MLSGDKEVMVFHDETLDRMCGRYRTLKAPVVLTGREMMNALSAALAAVDGVKFLL